MPWLGHARVTARFNLGPGVSSLEQASCTLNFEPGVQNMETIGARHTIANECFRAWASYITSSEGGFSTAVQLIECRCYDVGTDGRADGPPGISDEQPVRGTSSNGQHPFQVSNVVTLVASPGGKGRFGRIYLPPQGFSMEQDTGRMPTGTQNTLGTAAKNFLSDISNRPLLDLGWGLRIVGRTGGGTKREVQEIKFGRVPDTQRRRRTNLAESYQTWAFSA